MASVRRRFGWILLAVAPVALLAMLLADVLPDPVWLGPLPHFYVVAATSLIAFGLALVTRMAAGQLQDPRALFMALAFLGISGIFLTHALTTPGALVENMNPWVGFSAGFSLLLGAACLALGTITWKPHISAAIVRYQGWITALFVLLLVSYAAVALSTTLQADALSHHARQSGLAGASQPTIDDYYGVPVTAQSHADASEVAGEADLSEAFEPFNSALLRLADPLVSRLVGALTALLLGYVILRFLVIYRSSPGPLVTAFLASAILLAQSQFSMSIAPIWHASWWEYHLLMLAGFTVAMVGLVREYARSGSLQGVVGGLLLRDTIAQLQRGYTDVIVALVEAVEAKDPYTSGHTRRVSELSLLIGKQLGLSPERLRTLHQAAMLHDVGKIGIPDSILNKPGGLSEDEFALIREHPLRGYRIIQNVKSLKSELSGVRSHHERLDGSGYPDGLSGKQIPLDARIIAVADVFDALTSARPYREAWPVERALDILNEEAGTKLDPRCVVALREILPIWTGHARASAGEPTTLRPRAALARPAFLRPLANRVAGAEQSD